MGRSREDRIRDLREKADQLQVRARLLAQQEAGKQRARATRRRILLGACVDDLCRRGVLDDDQVSAWAANYLTRAADRDLFGLPPLPERPDQDISGTGRGG
jgi:hypothetical protein